MCEITKQFVLGLDFVDQPARAIHDHALLDILDFNEGRPGLVVEGNGGHRDFDRVKTATRHGKLAAVVHLAGTGLAERLLERCIALKQKGGRLSDEMAPGPPEHIF